MFSIITKKKFLVKFHLIFYKIVFFLIFLITGLSLITDNFVYCGNIPAITIKNELKSEEYHLTLKEINNSPYVLLSEINYLLHGKIIQSNWSDRIEVDFPEHFFAFRLRNEKSICAIDQLIIRLKIPILKQEGRIYLPTEMLVPLMETAFSVQATWAMDKRTLLLKPKQRERVITSLKTFSDEGKKPVGRKIRSITIDPGHGGKDSGAIGPGGLQEKTVVLEISLQFQAALKKKLGIDVFMTRTDDRFLPLHKRTAIANNNGSDIFISIHTNSGKGLSTKGFEVYYLNKQPSDEQARKAAIKENFISENSDEKLQPLGSDVQSILWDLTQNKHLEESSILAEKILNSYKSEFGTDSRGVKQAPFIVLLGAEMPAVLVEVDFISNPEQELRLQDDNYINRIVSVLVRGIIEFKKHYERILGSDYNSDGK